MEEKQKHQERINYIVSHYEDGRVAYTGQSVNYGCICSSWKSVEDLQKKMKGMIAIWIEYAQEVIQEPLEMKELNEAEWEAREDNTVYWELERTKRLISKPGVRQAWEEKIAEVVLRYKLQKQPVNSHDVAKDIMDVLINQKSE